VIDASSIYKYREIRIANDLAGLHNALKKKPADDKHGQVDPIDEEDDPLYGAWDNMFAVVYETYSHLKDFVEKEDFWSKCKN